MFTNINTDIDIDPRLSCQVVTWQAPGGGQIDICWPCQVSHHAARDCESPHHVVPRRARRTS